MKSALFVVGQTSTAAYLLPLWRRWLDAGPPYRWQIVVNQMVADYFQRLGLRDLPTELVSDGELEKSLRGRQFGYVVMSASFAPLEEEVLAWAELHSIRVARIIDTWYGYRRRLSDRSGKLCLPDKVLVIDQPAFDQAVAEGVPGSIIEIVGHPAWEHVAKLSVHTRKDVLFVSQPIRRHYNMSLGYTEETVWKLFRQTVDMYPSLFANVYYSAHPDDDMPAPMGDNRIQVVPSGAKALYHVGTVVGMFSSLVTDALLAGRHVVSFQPGALGEDMCAMGRVGVIPRAMSCEGLVDALTYPTSTHTDLLRKALTDSTDRLEDFCCKFANKSESN